MMHTKLAYHHHNQPEIATEITGLSNNCNLSELIFFIAPLNYLLLTEIKLSFHLIQVPNREKFKILCQILFYLELRIWT